MHQHPALRNLVDVLAPDLQVVELLSRLSRTGGDGGDGEGAGAAAEAFALAEGAGLDEGAAVLGPDGVVVGDAGDDGAVGEGEAEDAGGGAGGVLEEAGDGRAGAAGEWRGALEPEEF